MVSKLPKRVLTKSACDEAGVVVESNWMNGGAVFDVEPSTKSPKFMRMYALRTSTLH